MSDYYYDYDGAYSDDGHYGGDELYDDELGQGYVEEPIDVAESLLQPPEYDPEEERAELELTRMQDDARTTFDDHATLEQIRDQYRAEARRQGLTDIDVNEAAGVALEQLEGALRHHQVRAPDARTASRPQGGARRGRGGVGVRVRSPAEAVRRFGDPKRQAGWAHRISTTFGHAGAVAPNLSAAKQPWSARAEPAPLTAPWTPAGGPVFNQRRCR